MAKRLLVIDGSVPGYFFLSLDDGKLTLSIDRSSPDVIVRDLRAGRIRCEVEVADDQLSLCEDTAPADIQELNVGEAFEFGTAEISLHAVEESAREDPPEPAADYSPLFDDEPKPLDAALIASAPAFSGATKAVPTTVKQLAVIEGPEKGRRYTLDANNITSIGKSHKHADICLSDLNVARVHCEVQIDGDAVFVSHIEGAGGTLVNGQVISARHELRVGELLRVGATQFRLEIEGQPFPSVQNKQPAATAAQAGRKLVVIDGADQGLSFKVKKTGVTRIGKSQKQADICLNDLYVGKLHCELQANDDEIVVVALDEQHGTMVNGERIAGPTPLELGDIVRVGNSHLRLDPGEVDDEADAESEEDLPEALEEDDELAVPSSAAEDMLAAVARLEGQTLGHYRLEKALGRGHSGIVFRATDVKSGAVAALKVLAPEFPRSDAEFQGFIRALKILPHSRHAHLVGLIGAGKSGPFCWIAREHVDGEGLAEQIERLNADHKLGWKRACRIAYHLGRVLDFLYEHKVVHGNITPRNILICSDTKITKLADLMLVKALEGSHWQALFHERKWVAELPFYAPERLDDNITIDHRTDLYELGTTLYFVLMGHPPFTGATAAAIMTQIREAKIPKLSRVHKDIPPAFEAAVMKLLSRRPEDRYQLPAELVDVVEPITTMHDIKV